MSCWWQFVLCDPSYMKKCTVIVKLLVAPANLGKSICQKCTTYNAYSLEHILFDCDSVQEMRTVWWNKVLDSCPDSLVQDLETFNARKKTDFVINCLNNSFVIKWIDILINLAADMIYYIWMYYITSKINRA